MKYGFITGLNTFIDQTTVNLNLDHHPVIQITDD